MNAEQLYNTISPNIKKLIGETWTKAFLSILSEESLSEYAAYYISVDGREEMLDPGEYFLSSEEGAAIKAFKSAENAAGNKWNSLQFDFYPNGTFDYTTSWDEEKHQHAVAYHNTMMSWAKKRQKKKS